MTLYPFNEKIPAAADNPSANQNDMLINNQSAKKIIDEDHIGYDQNLGGLHRQVRMPVRSATPGVPPGTIPPGLIANEGTLYTKISLAPGSETNLFYTPDTSGKEYQLTRTNTAGSTLFGNNVANYGGVVAGTIYGGGWTFLPGNILLQYGSISGSGGVSTLPTTATIPFPIPFSFGILSINFELRRNNPANAGTCVSITIPPTTTNFTYNAENGADALYWIAIGI